MGYRRRVWQGGLSQAADAAAGSPRRAQLLQRRCDALLRQEGQFIGTDPCPFEWNAEEDLQWRPLRKGIADLHRRTEVSQKSNDRLLNALAAVDDSRTEEELTAGIQKRTGWGGRKVRGLRPWTEDRELLTAVNHGEFTVNGFRNRNLQALLYENETGSLAERRRSAAVSRKLRMLRAHGIVQKIPRTHRYQITDAGRAILLAVLTTARTSIHQLNQLPIAA